MRALSDIDWNSWRAVDEATLVFVIAGSQVLLMHKKRGLGAGKINAPGGRIEPGETPEQGAVREVQEELCVTPTELTKHGELSFQFVDGYSIFVHVFRAAGYLGMPKETPEARPLWTERDEIPYPAMWADDVLWVPLLLEGSWFSGRFLFDREHMLDHELVELTSTATLVDPRLVR
jgi:8-oxo-dGTP diphosphatase